MRRALLSILSFSLVAGAFAAELPSEYVPGEVLVQLNPSSEMSLRMATARLGGRVLERIGNLDWYRVAIPSAMSVGQGIRYFQRQPWAMSAEANGIVHAQFTPNDTNWSSQWGPRKIQCEQAWDINQGNPAVIIAIVDTGIQLTHPDLSSKLVPGNGFVGNTTGNDDNGHGTHCAGVAAAITNNSRGVAGVGFNCSLMPVKVLNSGGSGTFSAAASGVNWAANNGADVISMSFGGSSDGGVMGSAINNAWDVQNCVLVAAAGNNGSTSQFYPAAYAKVIAVGASTSSDGRASFSNYGSSWVDVAAPGTSIYSTYLGSSYASLDGTSMACPHVSGLAGLLYSTIGGGATNVNVRSFIENNCDNIGTWIAYGRINAFRSVQAASGNTGYSIYPEWIEMTKGSSFTGDFNSVRNSDDQYFLINQRPPFSVSDPSAQWVATTTTRGGTVNRIDVKMERSSTGTPTTSVRVRVELYNVPNNRWDVIDERDSSTTDTVVNLSVTTGASNYVDGSNVIIMRTSWFDRGTLAPNWNAKTDQVELTIR